MSVALPTEFENYIEQAVAAGQYRSAADVVLEAFRLLKDRDLRTRQLPEDLRAGIEQLERGEGIEYDETGLDALFDDIERGHVDRLTNKRQRQL